MMMQAHPIQQKKSISSCPDEEPDCVEGNRN